MLQTICPAYLEYVIKFAKFFAILITGYVLITWARKIIKKRLISYPTLRINVILRLISYALFFIVITIALQEFGINMTAIIGAAGVLGVAIGFAAQTSVANIISGLFLTLEQPFELNDTVSISGTDGKVVSLNLFAVTLCTFDNKIVRIPNEQVLKNKVINSSKKSSRRFDAEIRIDPNASIKEAIRVIEETVQISPYLLETKPPYIATGTITGNYSTLLIGVWATQKHWSTTRRLFLYDLKNQLQKNNISLAKTINIMN